jgi:flagellar biosynthetic protein FliR
MTLHVADISGLILVYFLVFVRVGAMLMLLPPISQAGVPPRVRLALALAIAVALTPVVGHHYPAQAPATPVELAVMLAEETTAGVLIGAIASIIMSALSVAGAMIATQTGLAYAQLLNPSMGDQEPVVGNFLTLVGGIMIFSANLHHLAIGAIVGSYTLLPPGAPLPTDDIAQLAVRMVSGSFALGLQLSAPFLVFGFVVNASIGLLARLMPQMQVFFIAMPINILAGLMVLLLLIGTMMTIFLNFYATQMGSLG